MAAKDKSSKSGRGGRGGRKRRGEGEEFTEKKANEVEVRKVDDGQLKFPVVEQRPGQFRSFYDRALSNYRIVQKHQGNYRQIIKEAKEANPLLAETVKLAIKMVDEDGAIDFKKVTEQLAVQGFVLQEFGSTFQITMHDTLLGDEKDLAYKAGFARGESGMGLDMKYPKGSDLNEIYRLGWCNGQAKIMGTPYGTTRASAVEIIAADKDESHPDPDAQNGIEEPEPVDIGDPMAEPIPEAIQERMAADQVH